METVLVAGRSCGSCNVCCVLPTIDDPSLQKLPGYRCHNALPDGACGIYEARPPLCRVFYCGWRQLKWIREGLRPDLSGVFVRMSKDAASLPGQERFVVSFTLINAESLSAPGLAESLAASIHANIETFLIVPGPPGHTGSRIPLNDLLGDAIRQRDKDTILRILGELHAEALATSNNRPVILSSYGEAAAERRADARNEP